MDLQPGLFLSVALFIGIVYVGLWRTLIALMKVRLGNPDFHASGKGLLLLGLGLIVPLWPFSIALGFILALRHEGFFRRRFASQ
jgi:hypothetical protein